MRKMPQLTNGAKQTRMTSTFLGYNHNEIVLKHVHTLEQEAMPAYTEETDPGTELVIPDPYSNLYYYYIMAKIDEQNLEFDKFNAHWGLFENKYDTMSDWYTRNHMPLTARRHFGL